MFIGHFAIGLGAKKFVPQVNLGLLFIFCQLLDLIWPVLVLAGIESVHVDHTATVVTPFMFDHYPYSHSLLATVIYGLVLGVTAGYFFKSKKVGLVTMLVTSSHWILDFITHRPDMPILFEGEKVGLGLWNHLGLTVAIEVSMFVAGVLLFIKVGSLISKKQKLWFYGLCAFLLVSYAANIWGPKLPQDTPPSMIAGPALSMWILVIWGYLVDRRKA